MTELGPSDSGIKGAMNSRLSEVGPLSVDNLIHCEWWPGLIRYPKSTLIGAAALLVLLVVVGS